MIVPGPTVESMDVVPGHSSIPEIERWIFPGVPYLTSVHSVDAAVDANRCYCQDHSHPDLAEVNVFLGITPDFRYRVRVGCRTEEVGPTSALFIPPGVPHSANVVSGRGFYVVHHIQVAGNLDAVVDLSGTIVDRVAAERQPSAAEGLTGAAESR